MIIIIDPLSYKIIIIIDPLSFPTWWVHHGHRQHGGQEQVALHLVERDLETLTTTYPSLTSSKLGAPGSIEGGVLSLQVRREEMTAAAQGTLLKFRDGSGVVAWVPVTAVRAEVPPAP